MASDTPVNNAAANAIHVVNDAWKCFCQASNPLDQAEAILAMNNAIADLISYHPDFDIEDGKITPLADRYRPGFSPADSGVRTDVVLAEVEATR